MEYTGFIQQHELETLLFGMPHYLDRNVFVTSHQIANVYTRPAAHYEVRCDEKSIDIQIDDISENSKEVISTLDSKSIGSNKKKDAHAIEVTDLDVSCMNGEDDGEEEKEIKNREETAKVATTHRTPPFVLKKMGEYNIGLIGKVDEFLHLIKKYGGYKSSKSVVYKRVTYTGVYVIPQYNRERFLKSLSEEGWNTSQITIS